MRLIFVPAKRMPKSIYEALRDRSYPNRIHLKSGRQCNFKLLNSTVFFMYAFLRKTKKYEYLLCIFLSAQEGIHEEDCTS